ncbi:cupin domain-containing protein [Streptomyces sp. NPDC001100]
MSSRRKYSRIARPAQQPGDRRRPPYVSGSLEFLNGDQTFVAHPGDFVFVPRGTRHRFRNRTGEQAPMVSFFTPGGGESLWLEGGDDPVPGTKPEFWPPERGLAGPAARPPGDRPGDRARGSGPRRAGRIGRCGADGTGTGKGGFLVPVPPPSSGPLAEGLLLVRRDRAVVDVVGGDDLGDRAGDE